MTKAPGRNEREGLSIIKLFQMFPDEVAARKWFEDTRWPNEERHCPHCGSYKTSVVKTEKPMPYHCGDCRKYFSVRTGTAMQSSKLTMQKWVVAIYLMSTSLKGVSSMKLHRDLDITQKTAWTMAQKIREGFVDGGGKLGNIVEVDETYIGGKEKNKHANKKLNAGRGGVGKIAVIGAKERSGRIKAMPINKTDAKTLQGFIHEKVEIGSTVYTDEHKSYNNLNGLLYAHGTVNHSAKEYVNGMAHTNGIESFWATLKRGYHGTHHHMSEKHLHRYVNEFAGRHNVRSMDTLAQMTTLATGLVGKKLCYQDLVAS